MSTPQQRVRDATRRLLELLEHEASTSPEAIALRAELAEATAAAGHVEDAFYQADELRKDTRRAHGPDHPGVARATEIMTTIQQAVHEAQQEQARAQQHDAPDR